MNVVSVKKNDLVKDSSVCFYDESGNQHVIVLNGVLQPDDFRRVWILFAQKFSLFDGRDSMNAFYEYDKGKYKLDRCLGSDVEFSFDSLILNALNSRLVKYRGCEGVSFFNMLSERSWASFLKRKLLVRWNVRDESDNVLVTDECDDQCANKRTKVEEFETGQKAKQFFVSPEGKKVIKVLLSKNRVVKNVKAGSSLPPFLAFHLGDRIGSICKTPVSGMNLEQMSKELYGLQQSKTCKKPGSMKKELKFQKEKVARIKELQVGIQLAKDQIIRDEALQKTKEEEARKNSVLGQFKGNPLVFKATKSGVNADVKEGPKTVSDATKASSGDQAAKNTHASYAGAVSGIKAQQVLEPIEFCPPVMLESGEKVVIIKQEYVEKVKQIFQKHLYGYFVGTVCSLAWVRVNLYKMWKKYGIVEVSTNGKGLFYFKFKSDEGMNEALKAGPWVVNGIPLVVKKWEVGVNLEKTEPAKVPVWITFKNVPLELWNVKGLCEIASCIGQPLLFDNVTVEKCKQKKGMSGFARILVEIPVMEVMPDKVEHFMFRKITNLGQV
ncbi:hypothetical protein HanHA300_Chr16g0634851 [Helianthus annuus]|nr:hypothetical protein HanHA300_Chr16g0634851 [Helianthus annuus]KAJ0462692.1 hypothetical protein HanHA89_Chr16g0686111 [Helianthus annuus]